MSMGDEKERGVGQLFSTRIERNRNWERGVSHPMDEIIHAMPPIKLKRALITANRPSAWGEGWMCIIVITTSWVVIRSCNRMKILKLLG